MRKGVKATVFAAILTSGGAAGWVLAQDALKPADMTFFVTSAPVGKGGDLGGLVGADKHCAQLAQAAGAPTSRWWRAYLSTQASAGMPAVDARNRVGHGPWRNVRGVVIAKDVDDLHGPNNNLTKQTALTEKGEMVKGRGDTPNQHDILTGSTAEGRAYSDGQDHTCQNWTSSGAGSAHLGHVDRVGLDESPAMKSWNASHPSRGCGQPDLVATGGAGLLYCFAPN